jgi:ParB-like chromosome segregation protein Spo0J
MEIIYKNINELIPYDNNPRINDEAVEYVKNSIKEFGFKVPIVIDKDNVIIAGHTRIKASKELGIKDIPCIIADDLTEEQVKAFRLADNKVSEKSMWDYTKLDEELDSILDIDMSVFDFNTDEIDWSNVDDLSDEKYEEPEKDILECPHCHHIDSKIHFKKVEIAEQPKD